MTTIPPNPEEALVTISTPKSDTVRVRDRVESSRFEFYFDDDVEINSTTGEQFSFPIDIAATLMAAPPLTVPLPSGIVVREVSSGNIIDQFTAKNETRTYSEGPFEVELMSTPMKVYLYVPQSVTVSRGRDHLTIELPENVAVTIAARSMHERPAASITVPSTIRGVMDAVSTFPSALKTTSVERSWSTLRGYPPSLEIGEELKIPETIEIPETDVELQIPQTLEATFQTAPLAYYLGATVRPLENPADIPAVVTPDVSISLHGDLSHAATQLLKDHLILDCIVRTEGIYSFDIHERSVIEEELPWNPADLYDSTIAEQISAYSSVTDDVLDKIRPTWPLTADIRPAFDTVPALSHLAEELAIVRIPDSSNRSAKPVPGSINEFIRADGGGSASSRGPVEKSKEPDITTPKDWETQIHTSFLDQYPLGSNKTSPRAYERRIEREAPEKSNIEVHVVCNDDDMREEEIVTELYGVRDLLEFEVVFHHKLGTNELATLLEKHFDLLHYIGHVDQEGFRCNDGYLDVRRDVSTVGVDVFLLNACSSVTQGEALLDKGSIGGIATLYDVPNSSATLLGRALSRLLNRGFTIQSALEIARESSVLGRRWLSIGDGRASLTQTEGGVPLVLDVNPLDEETFDVDIEWFETSSYRIGSLVMPKTGWGKYHVLPGGINRRMSKQELTELFALEVIPFKCQGNLYWTDEVSPEELV